MPRIRIAACSPPRDVAHHCGLLHDDYYDPEFVVTGLSTIGPRAMAVCTAPSTTAASSSPRYVIGPLRAPQLAIDLRMSIIKNSSIAGLSILNPGIASLGAPPRTSLPRPASSTTP